MKALFNQPERRLVTTGRDKRKLPDDMLLFRLEVAFNYPRPRNRVQGHDRFQRQPRAIAFNCSLERCDEHASLSESHTAWCILYSAAFNLRLIGAWSVVRKSLSQNAPETRRAIKLLRGVGTNQPAMALAFRAFLQSFLACRTTTPHLHMMSKYFSLSPSRRPRNSDSKKR